MAVQDLQNQKRREQNVLALPQRKASRRLRRKENSWAEFCQVIPLVPLHPRPILDMAPPKVAVLMCTMQGQQFLAEQLNSIATQTYPTWEIWASDDGSDDHTRSILKYYREHWGEDRMSIHAGPAEGSTANFLSLTCRADINTEFFAYSDQDDVWEADKLERAVKWLQTVPRHIPALYGSRTQLVDERNQYIGYSPLFTRSPSFGNALVQNVAGGNTMVFNRAARDLLRRAGDQMQVVAHDWWAYQVISGCGGRVHYDAYPTVRYRQHDDNQVGANTSWGARLVRLRLLLKGRFRKWNDLNIKALMSIRPLLTDENRSVLDGFAASRNGSMLQRAWGLWDSGLYRQTVVGNVALVLGSLLRKI
jgi:glycosyltransferase involved in cell wall biosynthesis